MREITIKYHSKHRKHRNELLNKSRKQCNPIFIDKKSAIKVVMDIKRYVIFTKQQLVLTKIIRSFEEENMQTLYVLGYWIDLCFHDYKLAIEIHENGYNDRNIDYEIKDKKQ